MALKLYLWEKVLSDYTDGVIFALAEDEQQARRLVIERYCDDMGIRADQTQRRLNTAVEEEMDRNPPEVIDEPFGFFLWGGG